MPNQEDLMFAHMMAMHHEQALSMVDRELARGADPRLQAFAAKMRVDQAREIQQLRDYIRSLGHQP